MKIWRRVIAIVSTFALLLNSLSAPITVFAQTDLTPGPTPVETSTPDPEATVIPTDSATPTPEITPIPTEETTSVPTTTSDPTATPESTPTQSPSPWTFEKVELNKGYVSPQNSQVRLTFTKLPDPSGNIKIEEITLTEDQVKETGSLSNKAYDITSDMENGDFTYNLSLPIPESAKGKAVEVKFAETVDDLSKVSDITETTQKEDDTITVSGLEHFTVFIITGTAPPVASNIIDDGDTNFSTNTTWNNYAAGIKGDVKYITNTLGNWAKWTFTDSELPVAGRNYNIYIHWVVWDDHVTNATYELYDSENNLVSSIASVDQNKMADGSSASNGTLSGWYKVPGDYSLDNGYYVQLKTDGSNTRNIVADAVKVETVSAPSEVWVDKNWSSSTPLGTDLGSDKVYGYNAFSNIQNGITAVATGGTINVAAGTYIEVGQIIVNKNLTIIGEDKATTIIKPAQDTGSSGDSRGWFLVNSGQTITLNNVTLDGSGRLINIGILSHGQGNIDNNIIKNIGYNPSGPDYAGRGLAFYDTSVTITNNLLQNIGRIGIYVYGSSTTAQIESNIIEGKGVGDHLDYAVEVEGGASAEIKGNTISNNKGVADVDGSVSAGILATTYWADGTNVKILDNSIHDNSYGVVLGYNNDTTSALQFNGNVFSNNNYDFDNYTTKNVDARNNTWSVADQNNLDQIEAKINHYCSGSTYIHGLCNGTNDYGSGFGMVRYKDIGIPSNSGWNIKSKSVTPNETPLDLACPVNTVYTNENNIAQNWSAVGGVNIKYQRRVTYPNGSIGYFNAGSSTYTPFSTFGGNPGTEGLWKTNVKAYVDSNGNNIPDTGEETSGWSNECKITYDKTAPFPPTLVSPASGTITSGNPTQSWNPSSGAHHYIYTSYQDEAGNNEIYSTSVNNTSRTVGGNQTLTFYWRVKAVDLAGNESGWSEMWKLTVDNTAPEVPTLTSPTNNSIVNGASLTNLWSEVTDATKYIYESYKDSGASILRWHQEVTAPEHSKTATNVADTTFWWRVKAIDAANNESGWSNLWKVTVDNISPDVEITTPTTTNISGIVPIRGSVNDANPHHYWLVIQNSSNVTVAGPGTINDTTSFSDKHFFDWNTGSVPDGVYTIKLEARDAAGNKDGGSSDWNSVTVDNTAPTTPVASPAAGNYTSDQSVMLASSDLGSGLENIYYTIDGTIPDNSKTLYTGAITVDQDVTIKAIAYDNNGNASDILEAIYEINPPVIATLGASTSIGGSGVSDGLGCANHDCSTHPAGQVFGISTTAGTWPKLAYLGINDGTSGEDEEVLGASTSASPTPIVTDVSSYEPPKIGVFKWVLTHKKISFGIILIIASIGFFLYKKRKK